jgi:hypothetical protein
MTPNKPTGFTKTSFVAGALVLTLLATFIILQGCEKTTGDRFTAQNEKGSLTSRKPNNPPPPVYFYFTNGTNPTISGNFVAGSPTSATITLTYINAPAGSYPAFTSAVVNGVKLTAPAGTFRTSSGSIVLAASGTPVSPGVISIPVSIGGSITSNLPINVLNAPPTAGNCADPGTTPGSTGCITFTYRGQQVTYATVRGRDGKIWLQQNLGSPQVALHRKDAASFGHYFQWGRWDDGHQVPGSPGITGSSMLQNPSHIASGNSNFIKGANASTLWWGNGVASNTWSGTTPTATNGKDPCTAVGAGWHLPGEAEWTAAMNAEFISDAVSAFESNLKLTESGYRSSSTAAMVPDFVGGYYWTSNASNGTAAKNVFFDDAYNAFVSVMERGYGVPCRCVKN